MLKRIELEGLFSRFNYAFDLSDGMITILTGPNGYGKSTILQCIQAVWESELEFFYKLEFNKLVFIMQDKEQDIIIEKKDGQLIVNNVYYSRRLILSRKRKPILLNSLSYEIAEANIPEDVYAGATVGTHEDLLSVMILMREEIGEIHFIREQRLLDERIVSRRESSTNNELFRTDRIVKVVENIPIKLRHRIAQVATQYAEVSNELDSTYPERLFDLEEVINQEEYNKTTITMNEKFEKLNKYDISPMKKVINVEFKSENAKALKIYMDDFNKKYKVYEDFIKRLDMFTDIVNRRLMFKKIKISREAGLVVMEDGHENKSLKLDELSSGEKEVIVLFYELIFEVKEGVMLLIDEPEISLHISWQRMFLEDLNTIVEYKRIRTLIATHSPQLINGKWDIQVDLGELYGNELNQK